jgi:hypothetical protein
MEHLQVWRQVATRCDPQVVKELDSPFVPEPWRLALGLRIGPKVVAELYR